MVTRTRFASHFQAFGATLAVVLAGTACVVSPFPDRPDAAADASATTIASIATEASLADAPRNAGDAAVGDRGAGGTLPTQDACVNVDGEAPVPVRDAVADEQAAPAERVAPSDGSREAEASILDSSDAKRNECGGSVTLGGKKGDACECDGKLDCDPKDNDKLVCKPGTPLAPNCGTCSKGHYECKSTGWQCMGDEVPKDLGAKCGCANRGKTQCDGSCSEASNDGCTPGQDQSGTCKLGGTWAKECNSDCKWQWNHGCPCDNNDCLDPNNCNGSSGSPVCGCADCSGSCYQCDTKTGICSSTCLTATKCCPSLSACISLTTDCPP